LAGLVGITAGADSVGVGSSIIIGLIAGILCVLAVNFFDKVKVDDPVGAISVHLVNGVWGTIAVGIFSTNAAHTLGHQLAGVAAAAIAFPLSLAIFFALKYTTGIRVSAEEEVGGLDPAEHGVSAYTL